MHTGSCLCGAVSFTVTGDLPAPDICHCTQCRKQSGHCFASTDVARSALHVTGANEVVWYRSSVRVRRGFCGTCGANLFWDPVGRDVIAVAMDAFDGATATRVAVHIFTRDKGDYYDIPADEPRQP